jgi:hypothetical protein
MAANLEIVIDATIGGAIKGVEAVTSSLNNKLVPATTKATAAADKLKKATGGATATLTDFGRVAQDAAFGPAAIANNLNPLFEGFGRLRKETGSVKGAFMALGSSLMGGGGIGLAISAITAAASFASVGLSMWSRKTKESAKEAKDALTSAAESVSKDLVQLQLYAGFASDATKSIDERRKAVVALKKEYPEYLKNISDEALLTGKATEAISASIDAMLKKATINLIKDDIAAIVAESAKQILVIEKQKIATEQATRAEQERAKGLQKEANVFDKQSEAALKTGRAIGELPGQYQKLQNSSQQAFANKPEDKINRIKEELQRLVQPLINVADRFVDIGTVTKDTNKTVNGFSDFVSNLKIKLQELTDKNDKDPFASLNAGIEKLKIQFESLKQGKKLTAQDIIDGPGIIEAIKQVETEALNIKLFNAETATAAKESAENWALVYKTALNKALENIVPALPVVSAKDAENSLKTALAGIEGQMKDFGLKTTAELQSFADGFNAILSRVAEDAVSGVAEGIGNAIAGAENPFAPLLTILGEGLVSLGKYVIQASIELAVLKKVLDKLAAQPALGIIVGAAMVALGSVIKSKASQAKFAEGGIVSGPMSAQIGEAGQSEVILPLSRLSSILGNNKGGGHVTFEIEGQKLVGVLSRAQGSMGRTYGR